MTEEVILTVSGTQKDVETDEPVEIITPARYYLKNDHHFVLYEETDPDTQVVIKSVIKIGKDRLDVIRRGAGNTHMVFERERKNMTYYRTPVGDVLMGIFTTAIETEEKEDQLKVTAAYSLELNESFVSDCTINLSIYSKNTDGMHIL